eukprot:129354_1
MYVKGYESKQKNIKEMNQNILQELFASSLAPDFHNKTVYANLTTLTNNFRLYFATDRNSMLFISNGLDWTKLLHIMQGTSNQQRLVYFEKREQVITSGRYDALPASFQQKQDTLGFKDALDRLKSGIIGDDLGFKTIWDKTMRFYGFKSARSSTQVTPVSSPLLNRNKSPKVTENPASSSSTASISTSSQKVNQQYEDLMRHFEEKDSEIAVNDGKYMNYIVLTKKEEEQLFGEMRETTRMKENASRLAPVTEIAACYGRFYQMKNKNFNWKDYQNKQHYVDKHHLIRDIHYQIVKKLIQSYCWTKSYSLEIHHRIHHLDSRIHVENYIVMWMMMVHVMLADMVSKYIAPNSFKANEPLTIPAKTLQNNKQFLRFVTNVLDIASNAIKELQQKQY